MFRFLCKDILIRQTSSSSSRVSTIRPHVCYLQTQSLKSIISESVKDEKSLINSCGFSLESTTKVSKRNKIRSTQKADTVLEFFRTHGFTDTQITKLVTKFPSILHDYSVKILKPKIDYFKSLGMTTTELTDILSKWSGVLNRSLENHLIPSCNFIRTFVNIESNLVSIIKRYPRLLAYNVEMVMEPNINILRAHGVPDSIILRWFMSQPSTLMPKTGRFEMNIGKLKKLGFDPTTMKFIMALQVMTEISESNWEQKMEACKSFGLSEEEILSAFKLLPLFMHPSVSKIRKLMTFFITNLEWKPSVVCKYPKLMRFSLEKSIIPRCSVLQLLMSQGLLVKDINIPSVLTYNRKQFLKYFVIKYQGEIPEVVEAHQGRMEFRGFQNNSKSL